MKYSAVKIRKTSTFCDKSLRQKLLKHWKPQAWPFLGFIFTMNLVETHLFNALSTSKDKIINERLKICMKFPSTKKQFKGIERRSEKFLSSVRAFITSRKVLTSSQDTSTVKIAYKKVDLKKQTFKRHKLRQSFWCFIDHEISFSCTLLPFASFNVISFLSALFYGRFPRHIQN